MRRLLHQSQHVGIGVLRGDFQMPADVMLRPARACTPGCGGPGPCECPRPRAPSCTPGSSRAACIKSHERAVIGAQQLADRRMHAAQPAALGFDLGPRAAHLVHVGRRAADVADHALEIGVGRHLPDFAQDRLLAAALDDPAFVGRDRAERAAAEAAAHDLHRILHHLDRPGSRCSP